MAHDDARRAGLAAELAQHLGDADAGRCGGCSTHPSAIAEHHAAVAIAWLEQYDRDAKTSWHYLVSYAGSDQNRRDVTGCTVIALPHPFAVDDMDHTIAAITNASSLKSAAITGLTEVAPRRTEETR